MLVIETYINLPYRQSMPSGVGVEVIAGFICHQP